MRAACQHDARRYARPVQCPYTCGHQTTSDGSQTADDCPHHLLVVAPSIQNCIHEMCVTGFHSIKVPQQASQLASIIGIYRCDGCCGVLPSKVYHHVPVCQREASDNIRSRYFPTSVYALQLLHDFAVYTFNLHMPRSRLSHAFSEGRSKDGRNNAQRQVRRVSKILRICSLLRKNTAVKAANSADVLSVRGTSRRRSFGTRNINARKLG